MNGGPSGFRKRSPILVLSANRAPSRFDLVPILVWSYLFSGVESLRCRERSPTVLFGLQGRSLKLGLLYQRCLFMLRVLRTGTLDI
ncbi:hypothetical protein MUK42_34177 [Musa troglodytarum]|uniref:Uncharacterized protein n=1 Tax=Musa troglodytarum TaxID=320322 RepID=A0A9E7KHM4_9LILI|nr:hypothetical protein MUK42_34177 [Musa troglodytarum]